jgi:hypothetical protein
MWKHTVQQVDKDIERCRKQVAELQRDEEVFQGQVFQNANTVVEVSIKTKKDKKTKSKHHEAVLSAQRGLKKVPKKHNSMPPTSWNKLLSNHQNESIDVPDKVGTKPKVTKTETNNVFKNRTLKVYLNEMKTALQGDKIDNKKAQAILEDIEFVCSNLNSDDTPFKPKKPSTDLDLEK